MKKLSLLAIAAAATVLVSCGKSGEEPDTQSVADIVSEQVEAIRDTWKAYVDDANK